MPSHRISLAQLYSLEVVLYYPRFNITRAGELASEGEVVCICIWSNDMRERERERERERKREKETERERKRQQQRKSLSFVVLLGT